MEAVAKKDFSAAAEDELCFRRGDVLKVLNKDCDPYWYKAELQGIEGLIPSSYIDFRPCKWFFGNIRRTAAVNFLANHTKREGSFLVRQSESSPDEFSLSVKRIVGVEHYRICRDHRVGTYYIWDHHKKFLSLNELIEHYKSTSLLDREGLLLVEFDCQSVQALFDFFSRSEDELSFKKHEIITVIRRDGPDWWFGRLCSGKEGFFPANYVVPYSRKASCCE